MTTRSTARYAELRPPRTDSNLFSYHLKCLQRQRLIEKCDAGYRLSPTGLAYVDHISLERFEPRRQPKIVTMSFVTDAAGSLLLLPRDRQPFLGFLTPPIGKLHLDDGDITTAARREVHEKAGVRAEQLVHRGDCYIHAYAGEVLVSTVLAHIFAGTTTDTVLHAGGWHTPAEIPRLTLAPGIIKITGLLSGSEGRFFAEITEQI